MYVYKLYMNNNSRYCRLLSVLVITNITVGGGRDERRVAEYAKKVEKVQWRAVSRPRHPVFIRFFVL